MSLFNYLVKYTKCSKLFMCIVLGILASILAPANGHLLKRGPLSIDEDATVRTEIVDRNNRTILARFNLTVAQMNSIMQSQNPNNEHRADQDGTRFDVIKEIRINDIKNRLQSAFQTSNSDENQGHPLHEMAAYPICNSDSTESSWMHDNNVTIRFSDSLFEPKRENLNLDSAILRLYKVNPNNTDEDNASSDDDAKTAKTCGDPLTLTPQIRVTVSIVQQLRRNKREFAIPWNYYGPHTPMSPFAAHEVPRYPRLDVKLVGYASFAPKNVKKEVHDKLRGNLRRQLFNHSKTPTEDLLADGQHATAETTPMPDNLLQFSTAIELEQTHSARKRQSEHNITYQNFRHTLYNHNHDHNNHKRNLHENIDEVGKQSISSKQMIHRKSLQLHNEGQRPRAHNRRNSHRRNHQHHQLHQQHPPTTSLISATH
ncbi:protein anachronism-like [Rhagoletis pomonella]|uniref:protein anachronism-like n=1 Tax=Rhagoletis pomonella TaxID=28610 RepID=UPI001784E7A6|nr:protein anachronism-like [Rhagoletis pomonella]